MRTGGASPSERHPGNSPIKPPLPRMTEIRCIGMCCTGQKIKCLKRDLLYKYFIDVPTSYFVRII